MKHGLALLATALTLGGCDVLYNETSITGEVSRADDGSPVGGAVVSAWMLDDAGERFNELETVADAEGSYALAFDRDDDLVGIGLEVTVAATDSTEVAFGLAELDCGEECEDGELTPGNEYRLELRVPL